jgi:hypothetical protein
MTYIIVGRNTETLRSTEIEADTLEEAQALFEQQWEEGNIPVSQSELTYASIIKIKGQNDN